MSQYDDELNEILREFEAEAYGETAPAKKPPEESKKPEAEKFVPAPVPEERPRLIIEDEPVKKKRPAGKERVNGVIAFLFILATLAAFAWIALNVHPDSDTATNAAAERRMDIMSKLNVFTNNSMSDALGDLAFIKKQYTIAETDTVAPKPDSRNFGSTSDPEEIQAVIDRAAELLDGESSVWDPTVELFPGSEVQYYLDETIFVLCWKEVGDNNVRTCAEVKIADGSQLRRKLAGDSYGSGVQQYASEMAQQVNAVVAINGDFYTFRNLGITAYQRQLYRTGLDDRLDSCFFTASGELLFTHPGQFASVEEVQSYMEDNDVTFAISFGPVLVDDGELQHISSYIIGEIDENYPRAAIGTLGERHYLLMTINKEGNWHGAGTLQDLAGYMYGKHCRQAYALDGGQTAVIVMNGSAVNRVSFGYERTMSDIIYFATALPSEED